MRSDRQRDILKLQVKQRRAQRQIRYEELKMGDREWQTLFFRCNRSVTRGEGLLTGRSSY